MVQLDKAISDHLGILLGRGFIETGACENAGYGYAERTYPMNHVVLKASCERGLSWFELGCADHPDRLADGSSIRDLLDPPTLGRWNLGMGAAAFVNERWGEVYELLKPFNWPTALLHIEAFARQRA
jgi:hypothetical protein